MENIYKTSYSEHIMIYSYASSAGPSKGSKFEDLSLVKLSALFFVSDVVISEDRTQVSRRECVPRNSVCIVTCTRLLICVTTFLSLKLYMSKL